MSEKPLKVLAGEQARELSDDDVAAYLREHPDFYSHHPELLEVLEVGHGVKGGVSLLEKQIEGLRLKNKRLEDSVLRLINTAKVNEKLSLALHRLALDLLGSFAGGSGVTSRCRVICCVESACRHIAPHDFEDVKVVLRWFCGFAGDCEAVSVIDPNDQRISGLVKRLFATGRPDCGHFNAAQRVLLFPDPREEVKSAVVAPLKAPGSDVGIGLLVLASRDPDRFAPGKGTMFLVQMTRLIESAFAVERDS